MYALHVVPCEPHVVLSLVLYKMVDPGPEVGVTWWRGHVMGGTCLGGLWG